MAEVDSAAETRANMSRTLLVQMAASTDPQTRENAMIALSAQGLGANGQPVGAAPAAAPAPTTPAPTPVATPPKTPIAAPASPPASPAAGTTGAAPVVFDKDIHGLGKYSTLEELKRGYFNAVNTLSQATDELVRLRNQPATVAPSPATLPGSAPGDAPRVNPTLRSLDIRKEVEELVKSSEESGGQIDPNALLEKVVNLATRAGQEAVQAEIRPMQAMAEAESYMRTKYPESINHALELGNFVKTDPTVGASFQAMLRAGEFKAAFEYAWSMYTVVNGLSVERGMVANSQIAEEERIRARNAAGFSGSPNTGVHAEVRAENQAPTPEEMAALNERAKTDQGAQVIRRRILLGQFLPKEWRTWENPEYQQ